MPSLSKPMMDCPVDLTVNKSTPLAMHSVFHRVLWNPLLLNVIFSDLAATDLKECRVVCHDWEEIITPLLARISSMSINKFSQSLAQTPFCYPLEKPHPLLFDNHLLRRIKYVGDAPPNVNKDRRFRSFLRKCRREFVEEISLRVNLNRYNTVKQSLLFTWFNNLKKITIDHIPLDSDPYDNQGPWEGSTVPGMPSVTTIVFLLTVYAFETRNENVTCHPFCYCLVASSPNLERLDIQGNFYPNLGNCKKLKYLSWNAVHYNPLLEEVVENPTSEEESSDEEEVEYDQNDDEDDEEVGDVIRRIEFSLAKLVQMLTEVKNSLEELEIGTTLWTHDATPRVWPPEDDTEEDRAARVPHFPRLVKLSVGKIPVFKKIVEAINPVHFPALASLKFTSAMETEDEAALYNCFLNKTDNRFPALKSAWIDMIPLQSDTVGKYDLCEKFPNVTELTLGISSFPTGGWESIRLKFFLKDLTGFSHLKQLTILIKSSGTTQEIFEHFCDNYFDASSPDLKTLTFVKEEDAFVKDMIFCRGQTLYKKVFLAYRNVNFRGFAFQLRESSVDKMLEFAREQDLRINFY